MGFKQLCFLGLIAFGFITISATSKETISNENTFHIEQTISVKGDHYYPPFEFINEKGEPDGFNVELFKRLADELGLKYKLELGSWQEVRTELENGEIDVLLGVMISKERSKKMKYGISHSLITHGIFTRKGISIKNIEELRNKEIIVQKGDLMHDYLLETGLTDKIITTDNQLIALNLLTSGKHYAALLSSFQGSHLINKFNLNNIVIQNSKIAPQRYAMAVSNENDELLWLLNTGLYQLKANGEYDKIYEKWFGVYEKITFFQRFRLPILITISGLIFLVFMVLLLRNRIRTANKRLQSSYDELVLLTTNLKAEVDQRKLIEKDLIVAKEKAEESDRLKSAFLANMSHEIRTPMNSIMGFASLLPEEEKKEILEQYAKIIIRNSEQLVNIIDDIVLYSKLQTKMIPLKETDFRVSNLFDDLYKSFQLPVYSKKIVLGVEHDVSKDFLIHTDYDKIRQVFTNLITNAYKYTKKGFITIGCNNCENNSLFFVRDSGIGIPEDEIDKVFSRFFRASNAENENESGTGLGLSIVMELIELLNGKIWIESKQGKGSTFFFQINTHNTNS